MIVPTVGRIVHYRPYPLDAIPHRSNGDPLAAIVVAVNDSRNVNLTIFDCIGHLHPLTGVTLLQDDDPAPASGGYCEWMAFQKGQAAKTEALAAKLSQGD